MSVIKHIAAFWQELEFANSWAFLLLVVPGLLIILQAIRQRRQHPEFRLSHLGGKAIKASTWRSKLKSLQFLFRIIALVFLIVALARPQTSMSNQKITTEGIDIVLALDISGSMLARDFEPDRLGAAKAVANNFIEKRPDDRIGLVVFAGESFTQCPVTVDHTMVRNLIDELQSGLLKDGTAIGMGLATSVSRLKNSDAKSRVVILLTDGVNNTGFIDPLTATDAAMQFGIRVYTIGVGTRGKAPYPVQTPFGTQFRQVDVKIDEALLQEIADKTNGEYYRATDNAALESIFNEIDTLEKSRVEVNTYRRVTEQFYWFLLLGGIFFVLELLLRYLITRSIP